MFKIIEKNRNTTKVVCIIENKMFNKSFFRAYPRIAYHFDNKIIILNWLNFNNLRFALFCKHLC